MAFTQNDIDDLEKAIALGATEVRRGDESVRYRSLAEMKRVLADMKTSVSGAERGALIRQMTPRTSRGL